MLIEFSGTFINISQMRSIFKQISSVPKDKEKWEIVFGYKTKKERDKIWNKLDMFLASLNFYQVEPDLIDTLAKG